MLPSYLEIDNWWEYLNIENYQEDFWDFIRLATNSTRKNNKKAVLKTHDS